MTTDELTMALRAWLGLPPRRFLTLPRQLILLAECLPGLLDHGAVTALARGITADPGPLITAIGLPPRPLRIALASEPAVRSDRWAAALLPLRGPLRLGLVAIWLGSAAASFALSGDTAARLLQGATSDRAIVIGLTWSGGALDGALGLALLVRPWRRTATVGAARTWAGLHAAGDDRVAGTLARSVRLPAEKRRGGGNHAYVAPRSRISVACINWSSGYTS